VYIVADRIFQLLSRKAGEYDTHHFFLNISSIGMLCNLVVISGEPFVFFAFDDGMLELTMTPSRCGKIPAALFQHD